MQVSESDAVRRARRWIAGLPVHEGGIPVVDPGTGERLTTISRGGSAEIDDAVARARAALHEGDWPMMDGRRRGALLQRLAELVARDSEEIAVMESLDTGNILPSVRSMDVAKAIDDIRDNAGWASRIAGEVPMTTRADQGYMMMTREPLGVAGIITPWNAPFLMAIKKVTAALAAGCTCVIKPAELAPLSTMRLVELLAEAGVPAGVVTLVNGLGGEAGAALAAHMGVDILSFTGSTATGRQLLAASGHSNFKRLVLELGGKSPVLVLDDADVDRAARSVAKEILFKSGQYCAAGTRIHVAESIAKGFIATLASVLRSCRPGHGLDPESGMGPIITDAQADRVDRLVANAVAEGAKLVVGGGRGGDGGRMFDPTLLVEVPPSAEALHTEIFGPVLCLETVMPNAPIAEWAARANDTAYGLTAKIWSNDLSKVSRLSRLIRAGSVFVNGGGGEGTPAIGGFGMSGMGREGGRQGVEAFTEWKSIRIGVG